MGNSRGLGPRGVLSELAVMDCEIRTKVTAELQRTDGAEETQCYHSNATNTATPLAARGLINF